MPTPEDRRPVRTWTTVTDLTAAHATVHADSATPGRIVVRIGDGNGVVELRDTLAVVHTLLTDCVAQVDAIGAIPEA